MDFGSDSVKEDDKTSKFKPIIVDSGSSYQKFHSKFETQEKTNAQDSEKVENVKNYLVNAGLKVNLSENFRPSINNQTFDQHVTYPTISSTQDVEKANSLIQKFNEACKKLNEIPDVEQTINNFIDMVNKLAEAKTEMDRQMILLTRMTDEKKEEIKEYDIYRDSLLRYLGYSNELGESFRPLIDRKLVHASYAAAIAYVFADTYDKSMKTFKSTQSVSKSLITAGDVVTWQMLASVAIPGFTINRICWAVGKGLKEVKLKHKFGKWVPTIVGLMSIPLIIKPIDHSVDLLMDKTYRKFLNNFSSI
ncbi:hypothetical protein PVAND_003976 [Polypedilum vanderplanki]|uniref:Mitochondrial fission process protein 1 n=1 Tax=Polypedilum vanderplanki TaxID=319348 RepID=A0A9J6BVS1_POLVA|nr:hypothetical protein PVAND_003976 [Polypedilum vanderplanki]